jgi:small conductance mechanosensitive channel
MSADREQQHYMPVIGTIDDRMVDMPPGASKWKRFRHHPATQRLSNVVVSLAVTAIVLAIVNLTMVPRKVKCASAEDCRNVRRFNTMIAGTRSLVNVLVIVALLFVVLTQLGVDTKSLLATAGVVGLVVGFGAQAFVKSFIAGFMVVVSGRYSIGDYVVFDLASRGSTRGMVIDFTLQSTTLQDFSGARHFISNGDVLVVTNYSQNDQRAQVEFTISHATDITTILKHLQALTISMAMSEELMDKAVRPPILKGVIATGPDSYTVAVAAIVVPSTQFFVERYMRQRILALLQSLNVQAATTVTRIASANAEPLVKPVVTVMTRPDTVRTAQQQRAASLLPASTSTVPYHPRNTDDVTAFD